MSKKNNLYYICLLDEDSDLENANLDKITVSDLIKCGFKFVVGYLDEDDEPTLTDNINHKGILKSKKLYHLLQDFLIGDIVDIDKETFDFRINLLYEEYFVFKMNTETKILNYVNNDIIFDCIESATSRMKSPNKEFIFEDFTSPETNKLNTDYKSIFTEYLDKCFGKNIRGTATFLTEERGQAWDIKKTENGYFFGVDENQNKILNERIFDLFAEATSCTLRVFTEEIVDKLPMKEVYGFILFPDFTIKNVSYLEIKEAHTTDNRTGGKLNPEKNLVYCDVEGNRLCSDDI